MTELEQQLIDHAKMIAELRKTRATKEYHYSGMEDFLLQHGKFYKPAKRTGRMLAPRLCFANSLVVSCTEGMGYVEGIAMSGIGFITHHGWNTHGTDAIDSTWEGGLAYLGVEFAPMRSCEAQCDGDASIFDDYKRGFPIYKEPWKGEDFKRWPKLTLRDMWRRSRS